MRVARIDITGMYGQYDFDVPLNLDERITILHGANGLGKTTMLTLLQNVLRGAWGAVARAPARNVTLQFDDGRSLTVINNSPDLLKTATARTHGDLTIMLSDAEGTTLELWQPTHLPEAGEKTWARIAQDNPYLTKTGPEEWLDRRTGHTMTSNVLLSRYPEAVPILREFMAEPDWLKEIIDAVPCRFIGADRLIVWEPQTKLKDSSYSGWMPAVTWCSNRVLDAVRDAQRAYAELAEKLDHSFPLRALESTEEPPPEAELRRQYQAQGAQLAKLHAASLIDEPQPPSLPDREFDETERRVLWTHLQDSASKLDLFSDLADRLDILRERANDSFLLKHLVLSRDDGLSVLMDGGVTVPLSSLSSGEQHLLVLACTLLFDVEPGTLVLIDEPELSLHIAWQQTIVESLMRTADVRQLDYILATHSPQVVHTHWDLAHDLEDHPVGKDPYGDRITGDTDPARHADDASVALAEAADADRSGGS